MMKDIKLAIVIPYYRLSFFEESLKSLANQTNKKFKVYIGDDASPQNPSPLIDSYLEVLNIIYKRFETNFGSLSLTRHWERCIDMISNEEWIMILGDDDLLDSNVVENFYQNYKIFAGKSNVLRYASQVIDAEGIPKTKIYTHPVWESAPNSFFRWLNGNTRSTLSEHVFTKETFLKYKFKNYPLAWHSDDFAWLDFPDGKEIYSLNNSTVFIRQSGINITTATDNLELKEEASSSFQKDLVYKKLSIFSKVQKKRLVLNFEVYKKRKQEIELTDWKFLFFFYVEHGNSIEILKLIRRFFIYYFEIRNR